MMERRRLLKITAKDLHRSNLYVTDHLDFFPEAAFRKPHRNGDANGHAGVEIFLDGLAESIVTDIGCAAKSGKSRSFLHGRSWVERFYKYHDVNAGATLALDRVGDAKYRLSVVGQSGESRGSFRAAEFFAGIGLVRLALESKGWRVVFSNDIDPEKAEMYRHNWPTDDHLLLRDIHLLKADDVPTCDLFTASFPCNDLSIAGRWDGLDGKESSAFWGLMRIVKELGERRPPMIMLENVLGFLMSKKGRDLERALLALNDLGYLVDAFILNAIHWAPQSRIRLFVVAHQDFGDERRTASFISDARPPALIDFIDSHDNIRWNLRDLPPLPASSKKLIDIVEYLPRDDPHWWNQERSEYFMNQMSERHRAEANKMISGRTVSYATAFRRVRNGKSMAELRTDGFAGCLRTPRGGSGRQILFKAGKGKYQVRLLTARECARLQGVIDSFKINVPLNKALFGFGDAVCVPAVEWIVENYLNALVAKAEPAVLFP